MAITQGMCNSFKEQVLEGEHDLLTDTIKIALYTSAATLDASTTVYSTSDEVVGAGYVAGGNTLSGAAVSLDGTAAIVDFSDTTWSAATITARGALIYNNSKGDKAIAVLDFGSDKSSSAGDFTVVFPAATASTAVIRLA
jgi:hypothetical protein